MSPDDGRNSGSVPSRRLQAQRWAFTDFVSVAFQLRTSFMNKREKDPMETSLLAKKMSALFG